MGNLAFSETATSAKDDQTGQVLPRAFRWNGEFLNRALENDFLMATWEETLERTRAVQLAALVFAACTLVDFYIFGWGWTFALLFVGRMFAVIVSRLPLWLFSDKDQSSAFYGMMTIAQLYVFGVFLCAVSAGGFAASEQSLSALMLIFAFYFAVPNRLSLNMAVSLLVTALFIIVVSQYNGMSPRLIGLVAILLLIGNFTGVQSVRVANKLRRAEFLTLRNQKELNEKLKVEIAIRQDAERAVLVTEENFQSIFVAAPEAMAIVDPSTHRIVQANRKALELFGEDHDLSNFDTRALFVDRNVRRRLDEATDDEREKRPIEAQMTNAKGEVIWARISAALVRFHGLPALLVAIQDVTARRHEAEALREARDQATDSSRSKSEFLANMSHELRTPLNAIIGFSEALERELFGPVGNPRYKEYAVDIHDSGVHLLNLINDILDLSKIEAGHFKLHEDETDLDGIVSSACRIVRHRAQQASICIETSLPKPGLSLVADERALKQILINLVSNAVKFSDDCGVVQVNAQVTGNGLRLSVCDQGVGIAESDIPKALAPFTQLDGTLSRSHEGTGLGLPLAKHLTELHGGKLTIESQPGIGTKVHVDLPASRLIDMKQGLFAVS